MELPIEHLHKDKKSQDVTLLLLLLPVIVFFLTIAIFALNYDFGQNRIAGNPEISAVMGENNSIDK
jgi:hypothetical protein